MAISANELAVVRDLIATGADLEAHVSKRKNHTPLHLAVELLRVDMVKMLIEAGVDINATFHLDMYKPDSPRTSWAVSCCGKSEVRPLHQVISVIDLFCYRVSKR